MIDAKNLPVLVTIGDPNGVGPEIAVKAAISLFDTNELRPLLVGDKHIIEPLAESAGFGVEARDGRWGGNSKTVDLYDASRMSIFDYDPGIVSAAAGRATIGYVEDALFLLKQKTGRAIVGCPHSETAVNQSGRVFSGYPNLLSELLATGPDSVFLMLVGGGMRIVHATLHEAIGVALDRLTPELIENAAIAADAALRDLGIANPRIGIFGINPHAGENGLFGKEDDETVVPAVRNLNARGINVIGPEGADTMLMRKDIDVFVAMYHDQGHIPIKLMAGRNASAVSIGGDVLFSSVGHGAAFDIAGENTADPEPLIRAIRLVGGCN